MLSDHADWDDLNKAVRETGAEQVFVTHGYSQAFSRWLTEQGIKSGEVKTQYEGELSEIIEGTDPEAVANGPKEEAV